MTLTMAASAGQVGRGERSAREEKPFQSRSRKTTFEACPVRPPMTFPIRQSTERGRRKKSQKKSFHRQTTSKETGQHVLSVSLG